MPSDRTYVILGIVAIIVFFAVVFLLWNAFWFFVYFYWLVKIPFFYGGDLLDIERGWVYFKVNFLDIFVTKTRTYTLPENLGGHSVPIYRILEFEPYQDAFSILFNRGIWVSGLSSLTLVSLIIWRGYSNIKFNREENKRREEREKKWEEDERIRESVRQDKINLLAAAKRKAEREAEEKAEREAKEEAEREAEEKAEKERQKEKERQAEIKRQEEKEDKRIEEIVRRVENKQQHVMPRDNVGSGGRNDGAGNSPQPFSKIKKVAPQKKRKPSMLKRLYEMQKHKDVPARKKYLPEEPDEE
jgi:signal transduction histidine kinase